MKEINIEFGDFFGWIGEGTCEWWILLSYLWGKEASQNQYFLKFIISFIRFFA